VLCGAVFHEPAYPSVSSNPDTVWAGRRALVEEGKVFFGYLPAPEQLAQVRIPCVVTAGSDNPDPAAAGHWRYEVSQWLAAQLRTSLVEMPDAHMPYFTRPEVFAAQLRPLLGKLT
jgi:pimeloyl-ACP methyl ester carboxylesterase